MTPKEKPIQIKCYCGHTIYCDCGPLEEPKENNHSVDTNEMIDHIGDANEMVKAVEKLIDKDIFDQAILAMEEHYGSGCDTEIDAYFRGAKWMQQQLKK